MCHNILCWITAWAACNGARPAAGAQRRVCRRVAAPGWRAGRPSHKQILNDVHVYQLIIPNDMLFVYTIYIYVYIMIFKCH